MSSSSLSSVSNSNSSPFTTPPSSLPPSPTKRQRQSNLRLDHAPDAIGPSALVGKTLVSVRRSLTHPNVVLQFSDKSSFQVKVDGYNPQFPGLQKEIELSDRCAEVFPARGGSSATELTIDHCASISMRDKSFDGRGNKPTSWEQTHQGLAFKFAQRDGWHCLWAMLSECEPQGNCIFRSFEDVYIARSAPQKHKKRNSRSRF